MLTKRKIIVLVICLLLFRLRSDLYGDIITLGILADVHNSDNPDTSFKYYSQGELKTNAIIDEFVAESVDVIIELGDLIDDPDDITNGKLESICVSLRRGSGDAHGIPIYFVLGNHECAYEPKSSFLLHPSVNQTGPSLNYPAANGEYGYFDIGNIRCFILDTNYGSLTEPYPEGYINYKIAYLSTAELEWFDDALSAADASGKFSMVLFHHPVGIVCPTESSFENWADFVDIVKQHRVVFVAWGHEHVNRKCWSIATNSLHEPIVFTGLEAVVDGNFVEDPNNTAGVIIAIDDQTGAVNLDGLYNNDDTYRGINASVLLPANCTEWFEADFNRDCKVNFVDFAIFLQSWLECGLDEQPNRLRFCGLGGVVLEKKTQGVEEFRIWRGL